MIFICKQNNNLIIIYKEKLRTIEGSKKQKKYIRNGASAVEGGVTNAA